MIFCWSLYNRWSLILAISAVLIILWSLQSYSFYSSPGSIPFITGSDKCNIELEARKVPDGHKPPTTFSYAYLHSSVYSKYGYKLGQGCRTEPWLKLVHQDQEKSNYCMNVFQNWTQANNKTASRPPPKEISEDRLSSFLLENFVILKKLYFNEHFGSATFAWPKFVVESYVETAKKKINTGYGNDTQTVIKAVESIPMAGFHAAVIGSISPWVEGILLAHNVSTILTIEYGTITSDDPRLTYAHPNAISRLYTNGLIREKKGEQGNVKKFDLVVTFSSIEHAGLGRFGDVLDPLGDVREMQKVWCMLKPGGIAMIGFPVANDELFFNAHRIYGPIRLPLMTAGFEVVAVYGKTGPMDLSQFIRTIYAPDDYPQRMIVLKKIDE